jgi:hypothetical protein
MARLPRFFVKAQPLHAIQRGNNREDIFGSPEDYFRFGEFLRDAAKALFVRNVLLGKVLLYPLY